MCQKVTKLINLYFMIPLIQNIQNAPLLVLEKQKADGWLPGMRVTGGSEVMAKGCSVSFGVIEIIYINVVVGAQH